MIIETKPTQRSIIWMVKGRWRVLLSWPMPMPTSRRKWHRTMDLIHIWIQRSELSTNTLRWCLCNYSFILSTFNAMSQSGGRTSGIQFIWVRAPDKFELNWTAASDTEFQATPLDEFSSMRTMTRLLYGVQSRLSLLLNCGQRYQTNMKKDLSITWHAITAALTWTHLQEGKEWWQDLTWNRYASEWMRMKSNFVVIVVCSVASPFSLSIYFYKNSLHFTRTCVFSSRQ